MTARLRHALLGASLPLALAACRSQAAEPAPPPASYELVVAPPGARGARAAGTDAAPPAPGAGELAEPGSTGEGNEPESEEDGGGDADAGLGTDAGPGVAL